MALAKAPERNKPTFHRDQLGFFIAAVAFGSAGIVGFSGAPWVIAVGYPLFIMVGYAGISYLRSPNVLTWPSFADSLYYLGFIFTMVALVASLWRLAAAPGSGSDAALTVDSILSQFGVALTTTILGLVARTSYSG